MRTKRQLVSSAVAYRILAWFLRLASRVFFRHIEVVGREHLPAADSGTAVLFAGNHPNSLIDPLLIITTCGRKVHFAAKDTLFKHGLMRMVLRGLGAVPVARRDDHGGAGGKVDNDAAFTAMFDVLGAGGAIGIFPEGLSHDESQLARLKTGAARLAVGARARGAKVVIVPCGLTFIHPKRFRSRVLVQYGAPIEVAAASTGDDERAEVRSLTERLERALRALTINAPDWETVRALDVVRRLYQPAEVSIEDRVELARRFNTYYPAVEDDPRVIALMARVRAYQQELDELGLSDRELADGLGHLHIGGRLLRHLGLVTFWLPMALPGAPLHLPTVLFARVAGHRLTPRKDVVATTKLVIGLLLVLLSYAAVIAVLAWTAGWGGAARAAGARPRSRWATLRVLDRIRLVRRGLGALARLLRYRTEIDRLRALRGELAAAVVEVVATLRPEHLRLLFPPDDPRRVPLLPSRSAERHAELDAEFDKDAAEDRADGAEAPEPGRP